MNGREAARCGEWAQHFSNASYCIRICIRVAGRSVVKLSPMCFVEPYNYTEQVISDEMLQQFDRYLRRLTTRTGFAVMVLCAITFTRAYSIVRIRRPHIRIYNETGFGFGEKRRLISGPAV